MPLFIYKSPLQKNISKKELKAYNKYSGADDD